MKFEIIPADGFVIGGLSLDDTVCHVRSALSQLPLKKHFPEDALLHIRRNWFQHII